VDDVLKQSQVNFIQKVIRDAPAHHHSVVVALIRGTVLSILIKHHDEAS